MLHCSFDTETFLIAPGCPAPRLVCVSVMAQAPQADGSIKANPAVLYNATDGLALIRSFLKDRSITLFGHHVFYDLGVLAAEDPELVPVIFDAMDAGRIRDTKIRQQMIDNVTGELKFIEDEDTGELKAQDYSLQRLVYRHTKRYAAKGKSCKRCVGGHLPGCVAPYCAGCCPSIRPDPHDITTLPENRPPDACEASFRLRYGLLADIPIRDWPDDAKRYALDDARDTWDVFWAQEALVAPEGIPGEVHQVQAAWALYLLSLWGMRTDATAVAKLRGELEIEAKRLSAECQRHGFVRPDDTRDMKAIRAAVQAAFIGRGEDVPGTEGGNVATDKYTLKKTGHEGLKAVADYVHTGKLLTTYVPILERGTKTPINATFNPVLETFRTSCSKPNLQNPPRKGDVRTCFVPRPGWVFVACDYDTLEMRALAQVFFDLFGYSPLRDALIEGRDLHLELAAEILGISGQAAAERYKAGDPVVEDARQAAKPGNFGFPGGMGWQAFLDYALKSYDVVLTPDVAQRLHAAFRKRWQMEPYFAHCSTLAGQDVAEIIEFPRSKQVRGRVPYTAICNGFFQELAARGAKEALYQVSRACYTPRSFGSLFGARPVLFLHDEIVMEVRYDGTAHLAADALAITMRETMQGWLPDVPVSCSPVMMRRWYKGAKAVKIDGVLVPSKPEKDATGKVKWVADV